MTSFPLLSWTRLIIDTCIIYGINVVVIDFRLRDVSLCRWIPDPYNEHSSVRQGITLDTMYQVVDICIAQAHPTTELDGITIGMICVRNLQVC